MEWNLTSEKLPQTDDQVACLVCRHRENTRTKEKYLGDVEILVYNDYHHCWDQEDGDDYQCDIEGVYCWMYLPDKPEYILPYPPKD